MTTNNPCDRAREYEASLCRQCGAEGTARCSLPRCGWKPAILTSVTAEGEVLVTMPGGRMVFMGFWDAVKFAWSAIFKGYEVKVEK